MKSAAVKKTPPTSGTGTTKKTTVKTATPAKKPKLALVKSTSTSATAPAPMTKVEKMQAARKAAAAGGAKKAPARKPLPQFKAPADFASHFLEVRVRTEADGLLGTAISCIRYKGRYDPNAEDKKKADMAAYDMVTMIGVQARFGGLTFKPTNDKKYPVLPKARVDLKGSHRLPANTAFKILLRVNRRKTDQTLSVLVKQIWQGVKNEKTGRVTGVELDKADPVARMFKRAARYLPAAFKNVQAPPARRRKSATATDEE